MNCRYFVLSSLLFFLAQGTFAQSPNNTYEYSINTHAIAEGKLKISVEIPEKVTSDKDVFFCFPKLLPDDYEQKDFGQFVLSLRALDKNNRELPIDRVDVNTWEIKRHKRLARVVYELEDTWDSQREHGVALAEGSSFQRRQRIFMNPSACFGYVYGHEELPFKLTIERAAAMRSISTLEQLVGDFDTDILRADNYFDLLHSPLLIAINDTSSFILDSTSFKLSVYSAEEKYNAKYLQGRVKDLLSGLHQHFEHLKHKDAYHFVINVFERDNKALIYNSLIANPDNGIIVIAAEDIPQKGVLEKLVSTAISRSYVSKELLSDRKRQFDYRKPTFSSHLWLYEGVQSYLTMMIRLQNGQLNINTFAKSLQEVMRRNEQFSHGYTLVELSENRLNAAFRKEVNAIHTRGLLTALCLDLRLLDINDGKKGLWKLTEDLMQSLETPFRDDFLFNQMAALSSAQVQDFIDAYVAGKRLLDYGEFLQLIGIEYQVEGYEQELSPFGGIDKGVLALDSLRRFFIKRPELLDAFGKERIGFQEGDVILTWNGAALTPKTVSTVLLEYMNNAKENMDVKIEIIRDGKAKTLQAKLLPVAVKKRHVLHVMEEPSNRQQQLRKAWLGQTELLSQQ